VVGPWVSSVGNTAVLLVVPAQCNMSGTGGWSVGQ
jgi:hypothetical protein